jgi:hypothetical protein
MLRIHIIVHDALFMSRECRGGVLRVAEALAARRARGSKRCVF